MAFGLGRLGLSPDDFWTMTPRELDSAILGRMGGRTGLAVNGPPDKRALAELMQRFPDQ